MTKRKELLNSLKGDWTHARISVSYKPGLMKDKTINTLEDAYEMVLDVWDKELINLQEQLIAFFLNRANKLIGYRLISSGTMSTCLIDIKLLVSLALHNMSSSVIIAHNHPSRALKPSNPDIEFTKKIKQALALIDVQLLDHLIISEVGKLSMFDEGLL